MSCSSQSRDVILIRSYETRPPGLHFFFRFSFMLFTFLTSSRNVDLILFFNFFHNLVVFGSLFVFSLSQLVVYRLLSFPQQRGVYTDL